MELKNYNKLVAYTKTFISNVKSQLACYNHFSAHHCYAEIRDLATSNMAFDIFPWEYRDVYVTGLDFNHINENGTQKCLTINSANMDFDVNVAGDVTLLVRCYINGVCNFSWNRFVLKRDGSLFIERNGLHIDDWQVDNETIMMFLKANEKMLINDFKSYVEKAIAADEKIRNRSGLQHQYEDILMSKLGL